ncbi:MAG TPA: hypothetical protein VFC68_04325 [Treponemataceae bacterium]|nr:hypothetical protein [Treponemataceae bacterium]
MKQQFLGFGIIVVVLSFIGCDNSLNLHKAISQLEIPTVAAPVKGEAPTITLIETEQYIVTISWSPEATVFAPDTVYTATIELAARAGYTFIGMEENAFVVEGATATNVANTGTVTAIFPKKAGIITTITQLAIPGIITPIAGVAPATPTIETTEYIGVMSWSPVVSVFEASQTYTATIVLAAKTGYTFNGIAENSFTVAEATTTINAASSGEITAAFETN